jgi:hypothetical protein
MIDERAICASENSPLFHIQLDLFSYYPHEVWRPIAGYEGIYEVSNHGRVKRLTPSSGGPGGHVLQPVLNQTGYYYVNCCNRGKRSTSYIHKLVSEAFLGPRPHKYHVNHKDADKTNNNLLNLEYVSPAENVIHGGMAGTNKHVWLTPDLVRQIRLMYQQVQSYKLISDHFGVDAAHVYRIVTRQSWGHIE